jgi:hypothetical protein
MLTCLPQAICSWNYRILDTASAEFALINLTTLTKPGSIVTDNLEYVVRKQSWFVSHWTLEHNGQILAEADKPGAFSRTIEIQADSLFLSVVPKMWMGRAVDLKIADRVVGTIEPMHGMTRRATIQCTSAVPELIQLFSFWMTAEMWRRAADNG